MTTAFAPTAPSETPETPTDSSSARMTRVARLGGVGGLVFIGSILAQNLLRASAPANDASPEKIIGYYADHRAASLALAVLFPIGVAGLTTFVGSLVSRARGAARTPAIVAGAQRRGTGRDVRDRHRDRYRDVHLRAQGCARPVSRVSPLAHAHVGVLREPHVHRGHPRRADHGVREDGRRATGLAEGWPRRSCCARCRRRLHSGHLGRQPGVRARTRRLPHLERVRRHRLRSRCCADRSPTEVAGEDDAGLALPVVVLDPVLGEAHRSVKGA